MVDMSSDPKADSAFQPNDGELLDAYSQSVIAVAERISRADCAVFANRRSHCSGVVTSPEGLIVTDALVVGEAGTVGLSLPKTCHTDNRLSSIDPDTDLTVIRAAADGIAAAPLGDSS